MRHGKQRKGLAQRQWRRRATVVAGSSSVRRWEGQQRYSSKFQVESEEAQAVGDIHREAAVQEEDKEILLCKH